MTDPTAEPRPLLGATADDPALERALRADLATLRDRVPGSPLARMLDDVLAGRRSLREVARTPEWGEAVGPAAEAAATRWAEIGRAHV